LTPDRRPKIARRNTDKYRAAVRTRLGSPNTSLAAVAMLEPVHLVYFKLCSLTPFGVLRTAMTQAVLLATPVSHETVTLPFAQSLFKLLPTLHGRGIRVEWFTARSSDIEFNRNYIATAFLEKYPAFTHLLFLDEDMEFSAAAILQMLDLNKPLVGISYVRKNLDVERVVEFIVSRGLAPSKENIATAVSCCSDFTHDVDYTKFPVEDGKVKFSITAVNGFVEVERMPTGLMLVRKEVMEIMIALGAAKSVRQTGEQVHDFFGKIEMDSRKFSEDYSFCYRWKHLCGGEIWCKIDEYIGHQGEYLFKGRYIDKLANNILQA
jgi:hypothetical protein